MIAIVNYDTGNIRSVINALGRVGCTDWVYTDDKTILAKADKVLLPGVGEASSAMAKLTERGLDAFIPTLTQPVLGICVGTQLMCQSSEEGNAQCMGIFRTKVKKFVNAPSPVRGQGDENLSSLNPHPLKSLTWAGIKSPIFAPHSLRILTKAPTSTMYTPSIPNCVRILSPPLTTSTPSVALSVAITSSAPNSTPRRAVP